MKNLVLISILCLSFGFIIFMANLFIKDAQQHSLLAKEFIVGRLNIVEPEGEWMRDTVLVDGKYYWHLGPFPAVILIVPVFIFDKMGLFFYQGYLQFFLNLVVFYVCYRLARKYTYDKTDALFLAFAFMFASVYFLAGLISTSWPFTQIVTTALLLLAINEYFRKPKRYLLIGVLFACIFATRFSAGLGIVFFMLTALMNKDLQVKEKIRNLVWLLIPVAISGVLLLHYNYARFGNYFDNGYTRSNNWKYSETELKSFMPYGLFSLKYVPGSLNLYFFKLPKLTLAYPFISVEKPGMSFFVISPVFLFVFAAKLRKKETKFAIITSLIILAMLLSYYYTGWEQIGPRYMLDLLPFIYVILLESFKGKGLPLFAKTVIILSSFFNLYTIIVFFGQ